jgi:capsular exopolysaccharide synthesis family protein
MELRVESDVTLSNLKVAESQLQRTKEELQKNFGPQHDSLRAVESELATTRNQIKDRRNDLTATLVAEQRQMIEGTYQSAKARYDQLLEKYTKAKQDALDLQDKLIKYQTLGDNYSRARDDMRMLDQDIERTRVTAEVSANNVSVANWATEPQPTEKAGPSLFIYLPGSVFLGLLISIGLALLVELIDNRIRTPQQIIRLLHLPVLGTVPDRKEDQDVRTVQDLPLASARAPQSLIAESFRQLRTALMYSTDTDLKTLLITSPKGGTGKSIVASNLAVTMAMGGSRVLLIDTNFRRPMVHRFFDLPNSVGLSSVLARLNSLDEAIQATTVANLDVLSCGPLPPSPADLLGSEAMQLLLVEAGKRYDNIILDGAPVLVVADAHVLCGMADGTVLVIDGLETSRGVAGRARRTLLGFRARLIGAVLNRVRARKGGYFREAYQSYYEYAAEAKAPK